MDPVQDTNDENTTQSLSCQLCTYLQEDLFVLDSKFTTHTACPATGCGFPIGAHPRQCDLPDQPRQLFDFEVLLSRCIPDYDHYILYQCCRQYKKYVAQAIWFQRSDIAEYLYKHTKVESYRFY